MCKFSKIYNWIVIVVLYCSSCTPTKSNPDLSRIQVNVTIKRFDQEFFACKSASDFKKLQMAYPNFYDLYMDGLMSSVTGGKRATFSEKVENISRAQGEVEQMIIKKANEMYQNFENKEKEIAQAMRYFKFYFPNENLPQFITFIGKFDYGNPYYDSTVCIGLELYLDPNFELYKNLPFPRYRTKKFKEDLLVPNTVKAHIYNCFLVEEWKGDRLIDQMINHGKVLCLMDALLPDIHDSLKIGYLNGQIEWCQENESQMWRWMLENDLLYGTNRVENLKYLEDGPYTIPTGIVSSSPKIAVWIGWQIVRKYMERTQIDFQSLFAQENNDKILNQSKYKP